jgi:integrase
MAGPLRDELAAHLRATGRHGDALVFGRTSTSPFVPTTIRSRARRAWKSAGLEPMTPHEARHCAASYLIAAGLNAKELSVYIGHSDIRVTYNRYGHLMPGNEEAAADRLTAFFAAQSDNGVLLVPDAS